MGATGTIVNGRVELDEPVALPEGTRVSVLPDRTETHEQEWLQSLRDAYEESRTTPGRPLRELLKDMAIRHGLPLEPGE